VGLLALGKTTYGEEEPSGASTPSRTSFMAALTGTPEPWSLCLLNQDGEIMLHHHMKTAPEPFLKALAPVRADLVVCVECLFTWDLGG
jgi:hypothetical protein